MRPTLALVVVAAVGCGGPSTTTPPLTVVHEDPTDSPLRSATDAQKRLFTDGDARFGAVYLDGDGLGPNFIRNACESCHGEGAKGPGSVQKMALVEADGVTPLADQSALEWGHTVRPYYAGGATTGLMPPASSTAQVKLSMRMGVAVFGRGYIDAVLDSEIERVEAEQSARTDGISGRINRVVYASEANPDTRYHQHFKGETNLIGRFGLKARIASIDDFAADASQGDMSITSPMRPDELPNPGAKTDDTRIGVDVPIETINLLAEYMRLIEIPRRTIPAGNGAALFEAASCSACHVPSLKTRSDYPVAQLAGIDAPLFSDLLLHDMGSELADGLTDGSATSREWRTAPLMGLRFFRNYLHDGRAKSVEEAILLHDGSGAESQGAVAKYRALSDAERAQLLAYVSAL
jgi:CxxC motif-containing protein (DUF1111 family)